ncbi:LysE/yggA [Bacillus thuringiensis serovar pakistani str. T13001]|nr:LysE/yggA [Bacillus thuringiensis serovar pakistani str. T13001]
MSNVSHIEAVNITGAALQMFGWLAPWLKTKTFCTPNGMISPNARMIP